MRTITYVAFGHFCIEPFDETSPMATKADVQKIPLKELAEALAPYMQAELGLERVVAFFKHHSEETK